MQLRDGGRTPWTPLAWICDSLTCVTARQNVNQRLPGHKYCLSHRRHIATGCVDSHDGSTMCCSRCFSVELRLRMRILRFVYIFWAFILHISRPFVESPSPWLCSLYANMSPVPVLSSRADQTLRFTIAHPRRICKYIVASLYN
jgi:hypothetical protein